MDVVIISDAKTPELKLLTQQAINTCGEHHIIVVESSDVQWVDCITVHPHLTFGYNKFLNIGAHQGKDEYIGFFNNDVIFHKDWERITDRMKQYHADSASPYCPNHWGHKHLRGVRVGSNAGREVAGWALVLTRAWFKEMGGFDESNTFWCSENRYCLQLVKNHKRHILDTHSIVHHLGSKTLNTLDKETNNAYTEGDVKIWNRDTGNNLFGWGT